ncbi:hypothetical protein KBD11_00670, partial [Candidatus Saccharibacteria bacterium]|nr:hypothetical protein [Candidatus Saccharibacteria bacterium]
SGVEISEGNSYNTDTKKSAAIDLNALQVDEFVQWNKQKDISSEDFKDLLGILDDTPAPVAVPGSTQQPVPAGEAPGIRLSGTSTDKGAKLSWSLTGLTASQGFKIVRDSKDLTPSFGENSSLYISSASARSETWHDDTGGTYYYRVCIYREGTCSNYSNAVQVTSPKTVKEQIVSGGITLTLSGQILSWNLSTGTAPHGFKVVLSTSPGPTYPENSLLYIASGDRSVALPNKEPGTYYVRLCKYTNGTQELGCVDYSNQVEYIVAP